MPINNKIQVRKGSFDDWANANPVLASGEPGFQFTNNILKIGDGINTWSDLSSQSSEVPVYVKNNTGNTLYKGQAVYINGAQGSHPTIQLSIANAESTSSKTLGLLQQDLDNNEFGYVITEGVLDGVEIGRAHV